MIPVLLGLAWGALLATPIARRARRSAPRTHTIALASVSYRGGSELTPKRWGRHRIARDATPSVARGVGRVVPGAVRAVVARVHEQRRTRALERTVASELPVTVDLLAVAVGAGCTPFLAVDTAVRWAPAHLGAWLDDVRRSCALGRGFADALDDLASRVPPLQPLVDALLASDRFGAPVGDALLRLAAEQRTALRRRAEAAARTVPVRLLFPLIFLVLPAFGLLTVVPAVLDGLGGL
jgi:tight adherence protein C